MRRKTSFCGHGQGICNKGTGDGMNVSQCRLIVILLLCDSDITSRHIYLHAHAVRAPTPYTKPIRHDIHFALLWLRLHVQHCLLAVELLSRNLMDPPATWP